MGEIADMMLDGTMDCETGEWNFDGEDGPGFPMTGAQAAEYSRATGHGRNRRQTGEKAPYDGPTAYKLTKAWRKKLEAFGEICANDAYHWQIRKDGQIIADWWPHKGKWRVALVIGRGEEKAFLAALSKASGSPS